MASIPMEIAVINKLARDVEARLLRHRTRLEGAVELRDYRLLCGRIAEGRDQLNELEKLKQSLLRGEDDGIEENDDDSHPPVGRRAPRTRRSK